MSGSWKAPAATGTSGTESGDATWIGIGGVTSEDLIQVGTENVVAADGTVSTGAFYELLPDAAQDIPGFKVSPGDSISASLAQVSASRWTISISNNTTSASWSTTVTYTSSRSSAEWIEEDPSYAAGGQVPFDNFGTVNFTGGSVTAASGGTQTIAGAGSSAITMVNSSSQRIAAPSALGSDGASFSVTRLNAN